MRPTFTGKRKRGGGHYSGLDIDHHSPEDGAVILSGDAAQVDYEEQTPIWKQEVTDDCGRKRLHGAFTGGFSAGYFNTVGSAAGWTPSTFVSSRTARFKAEEHKAIDYMDEEDLAEIIDDRELRLKNAELKAQEALAIEQNDVPKNDRPRAAAQHAIEPAAAAATDQKTAQSTELVLVAKSLAAKKKLAKPLSLLSHDDNDDDMDGFDIGPKIRYDSTLAKKKKGAAARHTFQSRRMVRNPEPEPETVQRTSSPEPQPPITVEQPPDRLLPSIGDWSSLSTNQASKSTNTQTAPHHEPVQALDQAKIPPWRRQLKPILPVASIGPKVARQALKSTFTPYSNDPLKHERYIAYLEAESQVPDDGGAARHIQGDLDPDLWRAECEEFSKCALMFKPMTGVMSKKFTSTKISDGKSEEPSKTAKSAALQAARDGKFGHLTRSIEPWTPSKLLCKRFNLKKEDCQES